MSYFLVDFVCFCGLVNCHSTDLHDLPNDKILDEFNIKAKKLAMLFDGIEGFLGGDKDFLCCFGLEVEAGKEIFHEDGIFSFFNFLVFEGLGANKL